MKYIVTLVDYLSKFVEVKAIPNKSGLEITRFIYSLFSRYGVCDVCISDNGDYLNLSILKFTINLYCVHTKWRDFMQTLICNFFISTGREFNNEIVDKLFKLSGVRHKVKQMLPTKFKFCLLEKIWIFP